MHVGDHADAETIERRRQAANRNVAGDALDAMALVGDAVRADAGEGAH